MQVISITTDDYIINTLRLCKSLKRVHPDWQITIYASENPHNEFFINLGCRVKILEAIEFWEMMLSNIIF